MLADGRWEIANGKRSLDAGNPDDRQNWARPVCPIFILSVKPASRYELKLIVSLITEWMSGRLYVPWLLEGVNVITDPLAIQYKIKFIGRFVGRNLKFIGNM